MPPDALPELPSQDVGTSAAEATNAQLFNRQLSAVIEALGDSSDVSVDLINQIAAAITGSIIGGTTGVNANRVLVSKGTGGFALQPTVVTMDPANGNTNFGAGNITTTGDLQVDDITADDIAAQDGAFSATLTLGAISVATLNTNAWLQQQGFGSVSLTDASTITWNAQTQQSAYVLLTSGVGATRALGAPSNLVSGFTYILVVQQSSTGSNALTYNAVYKWPGGVAPVLSTANNAIDILTFVSDGTNMYGVAQKAFA